MNVLSYEQTRYVVGGDGAAQAGIGTGMVAATVSLAKSVSFQLERSAQALQLVAPFRRQRF